ncbi:unnamed protein product [Eruca vesicaria subsp. sativa]|uniref:RRM domain-containing protein n=1 Tax=Eruca vesicaria subsp. sativa TaxID=29727 RepID=A0ABC8K2I3_ERUVS|nr:unnamed protein product [Eruca vesicaria subsp. sativa]
MASSCEKANFSSKRKPEDGLGIEPVLKKHREESEDNETEASVELLLSDEKATTTLLSFLLLIMCPIAKQEAVKETEPIREPKKTLLVSHLPVFTKISDILCFFQNVGQVVRVRLVVNNQGIFQGDAFVEFASAEQANKALKEKKNDKFLNWRNIILDVANKKGAPLFPPKFLEDEEYLQQVEEEDDEDYLQQVEEEDEDYLQQENLPIEEEDETPPNAEEACVLLMANLSPQTTKILHIIKFFKGFVGGVVSVRLIVNHQHKHVGYAFVEFASAKQAKLALKIKNGEYLHDHEILLMKRPEETPHVAAETVSTVRDKTLFYCNISKQTKISDIINFFKDVGEVVHVRLMVGQMVGVLGSGYVEFASATEAEKVMEKKNGEYLNKRQVYLAFAKEASPRSQAKYEDYLQRESLLLQEDAAVQEHDETPDFVEEVSSRTKTVFADLSKKKNLVGNIPKVISFFEDGGEVASVRVIVDRWGINRGCCCVEFATGTEAREVMQIKKQGYKIYVKRPEIAPYPFRPKYEDEVRREGFGLPTPEKEEAIPRPQKVTFCGQKIIFSDED